MNKVYIDGSTGVDFVENIKKTTNDTKIGL